MSGTSSQPERLVLLRDVLRRGASQPSREEQQAGDTSTGSERIACFARSIRKHRKLTFLALTDGSLPNQRTVQAVLTGDLKTEHDPRLAPGVALEVVGQLRPSKGPGQEVELIVEQMQVTGDVDAASYPLRLAEANAEPIKDAHESASEVYLDRTRRYAHLRPRDARHATVLRMRDVMEGAMADYFRAHDFVRVAAPILTASDCEGGGEVFRVEAASAMEADAGASKNDDVQNALASPSTSFWSDSDAYLTVSAQLHLEAIALGLGRVYTVGPSFRAEGSATNRHLAEFWMCEGEQITSSSSAVAMDEVTDVVEGVIKQAVEAVMADEEQSSYLWSDRKEGRERILAFASHGKRHRWPRISYTQAVEALVHAGDAISTPAPVWGQSLSSEQERWLARDGPVFVTHYPAANKPFYMRLDQDEKTVACFDLLVPRIGELVGGSLRETRADVLERRMAQMEGGSTASSAKLAWYIDDLRRYGCNPHGGFGLGIERLLSWITNTDSVRDVITFPRVKGRLHY